MQKTKQLSFKERVLRIVSDIPLGQTRSYAEVAKLAGKNRAYRAVGNILKSNYNKNIPCHRVICSSGELGGYNRGTAEKKRLLKKEKALK